MSKAKGAEDKKPMEKSEHVMAEHMHGLDVVLRIRIKLCQTCNTC